MLSWQQALAAFLTSSCFAALVAALAQQLSNRKSTTAAVQAHAAQSTVNSAATQAKLDALLTAVTGGGAAPPSAPLLNQLAQRGPAADSGQAAMNDCGEECAAMVVRALRRVPVTGGFMRELLGRPTDEARTSAEDVVAMLAACGIQAHPRYVDQITAEAEVRRNIEAGRYSIVLGYWISTGFLHWRLVTQLDTGGGEDANDPWGAFRARLAPGWGGMYGGSYVHVDATA